MAEALFGVLLDVSGSMRDAYALDRSSDVSVERTHAIFTTIMNIVKRDVVHRHRQEYVFACAFGLDRGRIQTCDFISLFDGPKDGHRALINLAKEHRAPHAEPWIKDHLSQFESRIIYVGLCRDTHLIPRLIQILPSQKQTKSVEKYRKRASQLDSFGSFFGKHLFGWGPSNYMAETVNARVSASVSESEAYKFAQEIIDSTLQQKPNPKEVQQVSEKLDNLLNASSSTVPSSQSASTQSSSSLHDRIHEFLEQIRPFIFGGTPMCMALRDAQAIFQKTNANWKVLFILSDGESGDGNPYPIAQKLYKLGVTIVTCFLTSEHIDNPRCLLYEADPSWKDGRQALFEMSSTMKNTHTPISYLVDANWQLPPSGESRLFVQANSLDVVNEFCEIVVSQMKKRCDALIDLLEKVDLATYINQRNAEFEPKLQEGGTCYANAIAAVFHLSMHRIVGREGGIPSFYEIRKRIIDEYGVKGANTESVLRNVCQEYRLQYKEVDETGARQAINERRPVIARFFLYDEQWKKFSAFYKCTPKGILKKSDVTAGSCTRPGGHAVVLMGCTPHCLTLMNSWGQDFADGGFFRVEDQSVLNDTKFYDVYWTENDLKPSEKEAFKREGTERARDLLQTFPSVQDLSYKCPICSQKSKVGEFSGHVLEAECPKCHQKFKPTNKEIIESLYTQTHNL